MDERLRARLLDEARARVSHEDPSHDIGHLVRVLQMAERLAAREGGDIDIIVPAALFHDLVNYPKNDPRSAHAADESAALAEKFLTQVLEYPHEKIARVREAIVSHSFRKGMTPTSLEAQIVQDADRLEATGAIAIMRTFASTGQMKRQFYHPEDPFCAARAPEPLSYALDLFYDRLLKVEGRMNTKTAKRIARGRTKFLEKFLKQFEKELHGK